MSSAEDRFPTSTAGLPEARAPETVELSDGDRFELRIAPVAKRLGDRVVRMLAYNGSIPGPVLKVAEGAEIAVDVVNEGDLEATVHWHGLRLENRYDGTHETQTPIPIGGRYPARVEFPDPGPTGTTRTSARTTARRWASTATSWSSRPPPTTGRPPTASLP
jgi:FtsP/CotA-like multicopper oxidase with cupredoxin domain